MYVYTIKTPKILLLTNKQLLAALRMYIMAGDSKRFDVNPYLHLPPPTDGVIIKRYNTAIGASYNLP